MQCEIAFRIDRVSVHTRSSADLLPLRDILTQHRPTVLVGRCYYVQVFKQAFIAEVFRLCSDVSQKSMRKFVGHFFARRQIECMQGNVSKLKLHLRHTCGDGSAYRNRNFLYFKEAMLPKPLFTVAEEYGQKCSGVTAIVTFARCKKTRLGYNLAVSA